MHKDDMRAVSFTADTEDGLLYGLQNISDYKLSPVQEANRHSLVLTSPSGAEIHLQHTLGSTCAVTTNILPQDQEATARPFEKDEATMLSQAAADVDGLRVTLQISNNDCAKLRN